MPRSSVSSRYENGVRTEPRHQIHGRTLQVCLTDDLSKKGTAVARVEALLRHPPFSGGHPPARVMGCTPALHRAIITTDDEI